MPNRLEGVLPIVHTPFAENGDVDEKSLARETDWIFAAGADGLGTGMVSELLRLTIDERLRLTERIVAAAANRGAVFAGVGAESTRQTVELAKAAERAGCDAVMAAPPALTRLSGTA